LIVLTQIIGYLLTSTKHEVQYGYIYKITVILHITKRQHTS